MYWMSINYDEVYLKVLAYMHPLTSPHFYFCIFHLYLCAFYCLYVRTYHQVLLSNMLDIEKIHDAHAMDVRRLKVS